VYLTLAALAKIYINMHNYCTSKTLEYMYTYSGNKHCFAYFWRFAVLLEACLDDSLEAACLERLKALMDDANGIAEPFLSFILLSRLGASCVSTWLSNTPTVSSLLELAKLAKS